MSFVTPTEYLRALEADPSLAIMSMTMVAEFRGVTRAAIDRMLRLGQLEEIKVSKTRYVRASSLVALQRDKDDRVAKVREYLEACARKGMRMVPYEPVMALVGLSTTVPRDRNIIGEILGSIGEQTWKERRVLLSVLVHRKTAGRTRPGPGFFSLLDYIEDFPAWDDKDAVVERETNKVLRAYAGRNAGSGAPLEVEQAASKPSRESVGSSRARTAINGDDGRFALDLWEDPESENDPDATEYADAVEPLRERVHTIMRAGRFRCAWLYRWADGDWVWMEEFSADNGVADEKA